ncbi:hypothetical protein, partial [Enterobacter hormaechei]|uniref:hypothetical protein n=1 Tax=Enterobacter hormaechei TaxID=158836 RepID=UPI00203BC47B
MGALNKRRRAWLGATVMVLACLSAAAQAQDLLVRNATVHTAIGLDDVGPGRCGQPVADCADDAALHQYIGVLQAAARAGRM